MTVVPQPEPGNTARARLAVAISETQAVLTQFKSQTGLHPQDIYGIFVKDLDRVALLTVDRLQLLIDAARDLIQVADSVTSKPDYAWIPGSAFKHDRRLQPIKDLWITP